MSETSTIKDKTDLTFIEKKSEKLVSGLYAVTGLLSDNEPLKWKLRDIASMIISDVVSAQGRNGQERLIVFERLEASVRGIVSLLKIARTGGLVSEMNFDLLLREYDLFENYVAGLSRSSAAPSFFSRDFFEVKETLPAPRISAAGRAAGMASSSSRDSRRDIILEYLKANPGATIKDISAKTSLGEKCSEKTIQRELVTLVLGGIIERAGERRWSKYSIKTAS
jgi:hypothetical protein